MRVKRTNLFFRINVILFMVTMTLSLSGCTSPTYPENVVAVVNKEIITVEDIEDAQKERKMSIDICDVMQETRGERDNLSPKEAMLQSFGIKEEEMNQAQKRFFADVERTSSKMLNENEALNILLTQEVLYQEAIKQGHSVSVESAKQVLQESQEVNMEMLAQDVEALKEYNNLVEKSAPIYQKYGFASEDDYLNQRLDKTAQSMAINSLNHEFDRVMAAKLPNKEPQQIELANAWTDYSEFLLSKAKVKILKPEYSIIHYGEAWSHGKLKLEAVAK